MTVTSEPQCVVLVETMQSLARGEHADASSRATMVHGSSESRGARRERRAERRTRRRWCSTAGLAAAVAAMAPDLDALIQSSADPLLYLEYHRQFTHA